MTEVEPIAVTVIGGYLGAGKTTLVNHILRTADERFAVLVNDFGDIGIDADLIESNDGDTMTLTNGCICCSLVDGFAAALDEIKSLVPRPDRLVIEASGVSDPASVSAWAHSPGMRLDAVVVMVDAETIRERSRDKYVGDTVVRQLRPADLLVLNKVDLVDDTSLATTRSWIDELGVDATLIETTNAQLDAAILFGPDAFERRSGTGERDVVAGGQAHDVGSEYETWTIRRERAIERAEVEAFMEALDRRIVRAKGFVAVSDADHPALLQRVGRRWTLERKPPARESRSAGETVVILIGEPGALTDADLDRVWA